LITAARKDAPKVRRYDARTRGVVAAAQKSPQPSAADLMNVADNGISTIRLR
jgi:hypothetical protein